MGLFRPYQRSTDKAAEQGPEKPREGRISSLTPTAAKAPKAVDARSTEPAVADDEASQSAPIVVARTPKKKAAPTRTRKQAEAERMEKLHPTLSPKEQRKADRAARSNARLDAFEKQEASPERRLLRDYVDSRWTINEFMLPGMILIMAATMFTTSNLALSTYIALGLWVLMGLAIINTWFMWNGFKKVLEERLPGTDKRGLLMYMFNRALMIRRFRRPAPVVPRGGFR